MNKPKMMETKRFKACAGTEPANESLLQMYPGFDTRACQLELRTWGHYFNADGILMNNQGQGRKADKTARKLS